MTISLSKLAEIANANPNKQPNIVLKIEGVETCYGAVIIKKKLQFGDPVVFGEPGLFYGGSTEVENQADLISFQKGTTSTITQNVNLDKGTGNSIQSMQLAIVDKGEVATKLITPGEVIEDIIGARCTIYFGYESTNFPNDFMVLFKGNVDEVISKPGLVTLNVIHPDNFKRANLFLKAESDTVNALDAVQTSIEVDDASKFFTHVLGPDATIDTSISYYGILDGSEVFSYTGIAGNVFTGVQRGQLGTNPSSHDAEVSCEALVRLAGNAITDIALKLMLSGWDGPFIQDIPVLNFVVKNSNVIADAVYFNDYSIKDTVNPIVGDYVTITGATNPANNVTSIQILDMAELDDGSGSYMILDSALVSEIDSTAVLSIRSQYDTWGIGRGMKMRNEDVDIDGHLAVFNSFLPNFLYDFYIKDSLEDSKEFMDEQVYNPAGCFSLVRQARASIGAQSPPLPTDVIKILNDTNIKSPEKLQLRRSSSRNFYTGIVYEYDFLSTEDKAIRVEAVLSGEAKVRFGENVPDKYLTIRSEGMRDDIGSRQQAGNIGNRRLQSYQFGAEFINGLEVNLAAGLQLEAGDVVLLDLSALQVSDIQTGTREGDPRLWRINRKDFNTKNGQVKLNIVDTNFSKDVRYGLISPNSGIKTVNSQTEFIITPSYGASLFGQNEFRKWVDYVGIKVILRNTDFSIVSNTVELLSVTGNTIRLSADPGVTITTDLFMEFAPYDELDVDSVSQTAKLIYASTTDDENDFADGGAAYRII